MDKAPPQLPGNPFSRPDTLGKPASNEPISAVEGSSSGIKTKTGAFGRPVDEADAGASGRSAAAGFGTGITTGNGKSSDFAYDKKDNPFIRKPPVEAKAKTEPKPAAKAPEKTPETAAPQTPQAAQDDKAKPAVTSDNYMEIHKKQLQEAKIKTPEKTEPQNDKPLATADNYTELYKKQQEEARLRQQDDIRRARADMEMKAKLKEAQDTSTKADEQRKLAARNEALANQARELQTQIGNMERSMAGLNEDDRRRAAMAKDQLLLQLGQIPGSLGGTGSG
jgi:hypothetical protein